MSVFSGGSGVAVIAAAGVVVVGAAAWFEFGRNMPAPQEPAQLVAMPQDTTPEAPAVAVQQAPQPKVEPQEEAAEAPAQETAEAPAEETAEAPAQTIAETPAEEPAPMPDTHVVQEPDQAVEAPVEQAQIAPAFDEVRRENDGMTIIAGRAAPGATVSVLLDGQEITQATADTSGKFAAITLIAPDGQGHVLSLLQDGTPSDGQIILAPLAAIQVAEAPQEPAAPADTVQATETALAEDVPEEAPALEAEATAEEPEAPQVAEVTPSQAPAQPEADAAPEEVAVLRTTQDGVELLNVPAPEVMSNVALDTISYSDAGDVQLAGRAQSDATAVRVYLDNNAIVSLTVDARGRWRGDLPDVDEGIYTLRVDEVSQDGAVTSRVETPFKRESPAVLANAAEGQNGLIRKITVQKGATLWAIAEQRYGDGLLYVNVFKANESDIRNPDLIYPGQVFDLPE